ncbi:hypothetical protein [Nonomuraea sp. NPDC050783]|uniref:hypothetical protein n=1 Tax=Nonomuraea sp. NPDC050783 TaxID=3154634 RepID=UPI00346764FD
MSRRDKRDAPAEPDSPERADPRTRKLIQRLTAVRDLVHGISLPPHPDRRLGYAEAIGWFVAHRPPGNAAARGGILRTPRPQGGTEVTLMFLDSAGELVCAPDGTPCATRLLVDEFDEELTDAFGDTPLLIIN